MKRGYLFFTLIALVACNDGEKPLNKKAVAQVAGKTLYIDEIQYEFDKRGIELLDSTAFFKTYTERWIKQQLLVNHAEKKLSGADLNVKKELENYRQELIVNRFEDKQRELLSNLKINDTEIKTYYQQYKSKFALTNPIVKASYAVFPPDVVLPRNFKGQITSYLENERNEADEFIFQNSIKYDDFDNEWIYFDNIIQNNNVSINNTDLYLSQNKTLEFRQNGNLHVVAIKDFVPSGELAPLAFVAPQISATLLNKKKLDFLRQFKDSLYQDGLKYNKFSVFNK